MKGTICQIKASKATGSLQKNKDSFITTISSCRTSVIWRTPIKIQMSAKMETNKQTKGWEIINQEICCKAMSLSFPETTPWPKVCCCWVIYCLLLFLKRKKTFWSEETVDLMHQVFQGAGNSIYSLPSAFINKSTAALKQRTINLLNLSKHWITYLLNSCISTEIQGITGSLVG